MKGGLTGRFFCGDLQERPLGQEKMQDGRGDPQDAECRAVSDGNLLHLVVLLPALGGKEASCLNTSKRSAMPDCHAHERGNRSPRIRGAFAGTKRVPKPTKIAHSPMAIFPRRPENAVPRPASPGIFRRASRRRGSRRRGNWRRWTGNRTGALSPSPSDHRREIRAVKRPSSGTIRP